MKKYITLCLSLVCLQPNLFGQIQIDPFFQRVLEKCQYTQVQIQEIANEGITDFTTLLQKEVIVAGFSNDYDEYLRLDAYARASIITSDQQLIEFLVNKKWMTNESFLKNPDDSSFDTNIPDDLQSVFQDAKPNIIAQFDGLKSRLSLNSLSFTNGNVLDNKAFVSNLKLAGFNDRLINTIQSIGIFNTYDFFKFRTTFDKYIPENSKVAKLERYLVANLLTDSEDIINIIGENPKFNDPNELLNIDRNLCGNVPGCEEIMQQVEKLRDYFREQILKEAKGLDDDAFRGILEAEPMEHKEKSEAEQDCKLCEEHNNLFSPGVYLFNLADFIKDNLNFTNIDAIQRRLHQDIKGIKFKEDLKRNRTYIELTNEVIEGFYQKATNNNSIYYNTTLTANLVKKRDELYQSFLDTSLECPYPNIIEETFDDYVNEFGVTREEVAFVMKGSFSDAFKDKYAKSLGLEREDLSYIHKYKPTGELMPFNQMLNYRSLNDLKQQLKQYLSREIKQIALLEYEELAFFRMKNEFKLVFDSIRGRKIDKIVASSLEALMLANPTVFDDFTVLEQKQNKFKTKAILCIDYGGKYCDIRNERPLYQLEELYKLKGELYGWDIRFIPNSAKNKVDSLVTELEYKKLKEIALEQYKGDTILLKSSDSLSAKLFVLDLINSGVYLDKALKELSVLQTAKELKKTKNKQIFDRLVKDRAEAKWFEKVQSIEKDYHRKIRENLLILLLNQDIALFDEFSKEDKIQNLADYLLIDLKQKSDFSTTPIAFLTGRLQTLVQLVQFNQERAFKDFGSKATYDKLELENDTWDWLKSYATWHAAMEVYFYPENFLESDNRKNTTWHYDKYIKTLNIEELTDEELLEQINTTYTKEVRELGSLTPTFVHHYEGKTYFIAHNDELEIFYSILEGEEWKSWRPIENSGLGSNKEYQKTDGINNVRVIIERDRVYLMAVTKSTNQNTLHPELCILKLEDGDINVEKTWFRNSIKLTQSEEEKECINNGIRKFLFFKDNSNNIVIGAVVNGGSNGSIVTHPDNVGFVKLLTLDQNGGEISVREEKSIWFSEVCDVHNSKDGKRLVWEIDDKMYERTALKGTKLNVLDIPDKSGTSNDNIYKSENYTPTITKLGNQYLGFQKDGSILSYHISDRFVHLYYDNIGNKLTISDINNISKEIVQKTSLVATDQAYTYFREVASYIPSFLAERFDEEKQHERAKGWRNLIIDFGKLDQGASIDEALRLDLSAIDRDYQLWIDKPFDPYYHSNAFPQIQVAATKLNYVEGIISEADDLFVQDNAESIGRARVLYEQAFSILKRGDTIADSCAIASIKAIDDFQNEETSSVIEGAIIPGHSFDVTKNQYADVIVGYGSKFYSGVITATMKDADISPVLRAVAVSQHSQDLVKQNEQYTFASAQQRVSSVQSVKYSSSNLITSFVLQGAPLSRQMTSSTTGREVIGTGSIIASRAKPSAKVRHVLRIEPIAFCLPKNPRRNLLLWKAESQLEKIRAGQNIAGIKRELSLYPIKVNPEKILDAGSIANYNRASVSNNFPPIYRYSFLIERAKYLVSIAQQFENSLLNTSDKVYTEEYTLFQAQQDIQLERANITLQDLRLREAIFNVNQAKQQIFRANTQYSHYDNLIKAGLNSHEKAALGFQITAGTLQTLAAANAASNSFNPLAWLNGENPVADGLNSLGIAASTTANIFQTKATHERRKEDWKLARQLASVDERIAELGVQQAYNRVDIAKQEGTIANLRLSLANDKLAFIFKHNRKGLYAWMRDFYKRLYQEQMHMAVATAKAAQQALAFERQTDYDFIGYDYSQYQRDGVYLGASRLLVDIGKLEQEKLTTTERKREIKKVLSLSSLAPEEFESFRRTGVLEFATLKSLFDRDFPGHYMRTIKSVELTVVGLIPPLEGIKGTLYNTGLSRVMKGGPFDEMTDIYKLPEAITISAGASNNGVFPLRPDEPLLYPFEGSGVVTNWRFEMDKGANPIDYDNIYDIYFTINYTSLEDRSYRQKILEEMGQDEFGNIAISSKRFFSLRNEFADEWYQFQNPILLSDTSLYINPIARDELPEDIETVLPYTMIIDLDEEVFLKNEKQQSIRKISVAARVKNNSGDYYDEINLPLHLKFYPASAISEKVKDKLKIQNVYDESYEFNTQKPFGKWVIQLDVANLSEPLKTIKPTDDGGEIVTIHADLIEDLLLVVEYKANVNYNRGF